MIPWKKMKLIGCLGIFLLTFILFCGCGKETAKNAMNHGFDSDLNYIVDKGSLIVGVTNFKPLDYLQDSEWIGFDAELAGFFAESLGLSVEFMEIDWDEKEELLNNGTIDCVWNGMTLSEEVKKAMECSMAYLNNAQVIVVPEENSEQLQTVEDCMHLLFAVEAGSAGEKELKERNYRYRQADSQMGALSEVSSGETDAAVIDIIMAGALIGKGKQFEHLVCTDSISSEEYAVGFRKGSDLAEKLNDFWKEIYQNGTVEETAEKYGIQADSLIPPK